MATDADKEEQSYIDMQEEIPAETRSWDMQALLEARKLDASIINYYRSQAKDPTLQTPPLTTDAIIEDICRDDDAMDQRLIDYCRIALLGPEPSILFKGDFLKDLYPFFTVNPSEFGSQVAATFFPDALKPIPWTTRLVLKAITAAIVFGSQKENKNIPATIKLLEVTQKALSSVPAESHQATLNQFSPTITVAELSFVIARYQYRMYTVMERDTPEANKAFVSGLEKAGLDMIKALQDRPDGYYVAGCARFEQMDASGACAHWRKGLQVAEALKHTYYTCVLKYELAWGIISGGEGPHFVFRTVYDLVSQGKDAAKVLNFYKPAEKNELYQVQHIVNNVMENAIPPGAKLDDKLKAAPLSYAPGASPATTIDSNGRGNVEQAAAAAGAVSMAMTEEQKAAFEKMMTCDYCGMRAMELKRCSGCREAHYCSKDCQSKAWPGHKEDCKAIQRQVEQAAQ